MRSCTDIMPSKKKKYNARFPAGRIKKIMQTDEDVGKVAQAVPVIISRTLELFVESLLKRAMQITSAKNAKTLTPSHMKQCILSESRFDFLKDLVKGIPDVSNADDESITTVGNISPRVTPTSAKPPGNFSCFQFRRKSDGGATKSSATTSQQSSVPQTIFPKFYKEIAIGGDDSNQEENENSRKDEERITPTSCRAPVIQHTGPRLNHLSSPQNSAQEKCPSTTLSACNAGILNENKYTTNCISVDPSRNSSSDGEEEDDEPQKNGYHRLEIVTKTCAIDEDYDT